MSYKPEEFMFILKFLGVLFFVGTIILLLPNPYKYDEMFCTEEFPELAETGRFNSLKHVAGMKNCCFDVPVLEDGLWFGQIDCKGVIE